MTGPGMQVVPAIWPKECNDYSIGIELEGSDDLPFEQAQYDALVKVTACLQDYYPKLAAAYCRTFGHCTGT